MLMSFEGTVGIYQGEELGQLETDMEFHELTDPPAIRFWPAVKGRDGCRTPMTWEQDAENAGFSNAKPWLPVKPPQIARAVDGQEAANDSVLHFYRDAIAFRKNNPAFTVGKTQFLDTPEPVLAFTRTADDQRLTCVFNLSADPQTITFDTSAAICGPHHATLDGNTLHLPGNGFVYLAHGADIALAA
jgi:alpha-glucosidase